MFSLFSVVINTSVPIHRPIKIFVLFITGLAVTKARHTTLKKKVRLEEPNCIRGYGWFVLSRGWLREREREGEREKTHKERQRNGGALHFVNEYMCQGGRREIRGGR